MKMVFKQWLAAIALALLTSLAHAQYSQIYVFGDSLSDNGNLKAVTQNPQIPERFTNGPVAMELVAAQLGLSLTPSFHLLPPEAVGGQYGNNYAIAGAVAIDKDGDPATLDINLPSQVNLFLALNNGYAPADALYVVFIGGNDLFAAHDLVLNGGFKGSEKAIKRLEKANKAVEAQIRALAAAGAQHFLLVNAPDIGAAPITDIKRDIASAQASNWLELLVTRNLESVSRLLSRIYNTGLAYQAAVLRHDLGVDITEYDLFGFLDDTIGHATEYGYTNTTNACIYLQTQSGTPNPQCDFNSFVFFDEIHPTAVTHQRAAFEIVQLLSR